MTLFDDIWNRQISTQLQPDAWTGGYIYNAAQ